MNRPITETETMKHGYIYLTLVLFQSFYIDTSQYIKNIALQIKSCKIIKFGNQLV